MIVQNDVRGSVFLTCQICELCWTPKKTRRKRLERYKIEGKIKEAIRAELMPHSSPEVGHNQAVVLHAIHVHQNCVSIRLTVRSLNGSGSF
jgi:hypothetical protein